MELQSSLENPKTSRLKTELGEYAQKLHTALGIEQNTSIVFVTDQELVDTLKNAIESNKPVYLQTLADRYNTEHVDLDKELENMMLSAPSIVALDPSVVTKIKGIESVFVRPDRYLKDQKLQKSQNEKFDFDEPLHRAKAELAHHLITHTNQKQYVLDFALTKLPKELDQKYLIRMLDGIGFEGYERNPETGKIDVTKSYKLRGLNDALVRLKIEEINGQYNMPSYFDDSNLAAKSFLQSVMNMTNTSLDQMEMFRTKTGILGLLHHWASEFRGNIPAAVELYSLCTDVCNNHMAFDLGMIKLNEFVQKYKNV